MDLKGVTKRKRILIADDEEDLRSILQERLKAEGYEVETAGDGKNTLETAIVFKPDLILLDVMMPRMDGFNVLDRLKTSEDTMDIPVIMMTGKTGEEDIRKGISGYAEKYITKPFEWDYLIGEVRKSLDLRTDR